MWAQIDHAFLPTFAVLLLTISVSLSLAMQRVVKRLRSKYPILWEHLGSPNPGLYWALGLDMLLFVTAYRPTVAAWFVRGEYRTLNDVELNLQAQRVRFQAAFYVAIILAVIVYSGLRVAGG